MSLHSIRSRSTYFCGFVGNGSEHRNFSYDTIDNILMQRVFQDLAGYPRILGIVNLRPLRGRHAYKGLPEVGPARLLAAMLRDLGVSTLRSRSCLSFLLFLEHQTIHAACFNARGLLYECVFDALLFSSSYRLVGRPISHHVVTRPILFFSSSFLDHHTGHLARHDALILLMSASPMPSEFFHRRFDLLEACFL
jgi:hypothetical protein